METNANKSLQAILDRLDRIESDLGDLHRRVAVLDGTRTSPTQASGAYAPAIKGAAIRNQIPPPPAQVFCPNCRGGNPPGTFNCMWCGRPMPMPAIGPQMGTAPQPPVPQPPVPQAALAAWPDIRFPDVQHAAEAVPLPLAVVHHKARHVSVSKGNERHLAAFKIQPAEGAPAGAKAEIAVPSAPVAPEKTPEAAAHIMLPQAPRPSFDFLKRSEFWLNKVGIALLLLGLAFFFKYSIDQGWLNEPVRVGLGLALGSVLLGFGVTLHRQRSHFSQVLLGGGIATYYISGYAAYQLFNLVPYEVAFGFMALVTALAFVLAVWQDEAILSLIGVAGGLLTPFVLTAPSAGVTGLITYTCIVLAGASAIYFYKGWRSLLWVSYVGGWSVFLLGYRAAIWPGESDMGDRWALQLGALFGLAAFWAVPVLREVLYHRNPKGWQRPSLERIPVVKDVMDMRINVRLVHVLAVAAPLVTLGYSRLVWGNMVTMPQWGWITILAAAIYGLTAWLLRRNLPALAYTHTLMGILLVTLGVVQILEGDMLIFALAVEATALHFVSRRLSDKGTAVYGHLISIGVALWVGIRLMDALYAQQGLTASTLTDLAVIAMLAASSFAVRPGEIVTGYRLFVHMGVMAWLFGQLYGLPNWSGPVMLAWAAYAIALYALHWKFPSRFGQFDVAIPAHAVFTAAALLFAGRIASGQIGEMSVFNLNTLMDAGLVAMAVALSFIAAPKEAVAAYRIAAHMGVLALLWRELSVLDNGISYVMLCWALYGLGMHYLAKLLPGGIESASLSLAANVPFVGVALWFAQGLRDPVPDAAVVFNLPALISLACIGLAFGASFIAKPREAVLSYWMGAYLATLGWLWHELRILSNGDGYVILSWAVLATLVLYLARRISDKLEKLGFISTGSITFGLVGAWLAQRLLVLTPEGTPVLNIAAATDLAVIALAVTAGWLVQPWKATWGYLLGAHVALLAWFWRELGAFENGNAFVTIAWGAYAIALLIGGLRGERNMAWVYAGIATLSIVVIKLFLLDLSALDPLWRVLLFMGFGGIFLLLSYFFQNVIGGKPGSVGRGAGTRPHWPGRPAH